MSNSRYCRVGPLERQRSVSETEPEDQPLFFASVRTRGPTGARVISLVHVINFKLIVCIKPIWLRKHQQEVPCGRCFECVRRRRNDWYIRCLFESRSRKFTYFGLLTYAEVGSVLEKRDIQLFLKRLRSYGYKFSYFIAGEHGELRDRPHWHCLFFSDDPIGYKHIAQAWRGGFKRPDDNVAGWIRFEPIKSARSIRYTVKYIYKYSGMDPPFLSYGLQKPRNRSWFS